MPNNSEPEQNISITQLLEGGYGQHHPYPENILWPIEFANASLSKDLELKTQVCAGAEIPEDWVVNLRKMELVVFTQPRGQGYASRQASTQGEVYPGAFPDAAVSVTRILRN